MPSLIGIWNSFFEKTFARRFVRDVGVLTAAQFGGAVLSLIQGILVARWLGPEFYGVVALIMSYPNLVYTFFDARSAQASVKYLSEFHAQGKKEQVLAMCKLGYAVDFAIALLAFLIVLLTSYWVAHRIVHQPEAVWLIITYSAAAVPRALVGTSRAVLATLGLFSVIAWINILTTVIRVVSVLGLVWAGYQVKGVIWGNAIAMIITGFLFGIVSHRVIGQTWGASWLRGRWLALKGRRREIFSFLAYNDLNALLGMIPKQLDVVLLGYFRDTTEVGYYRLAKRLAGVVSYLVGPLQSVTYPELARLCGVGNLIATHQKVCRLALYIGAPLGLAVSAGTLLIPPILPLIVGTAYIPAVPATQLLLIGAAAWLTFFWLRPTYLALGRIRQWLTINTLVVTLSMVAYPLIIPYWGFMGLSTWWMVTQIWSHMVAAIYLAKQRRSSEIKHV